MSYPYCLHDANVALALVLGPPAPGPLTLEPVEACRLLDSFVVGRC